MDTRLLARDMPVGLGVVKEDRMPGRDCVLPDLGLSGPAPVVAEGEAEGLGLGLFAEVAHEVISRCCEDGLLEGNKWFERSPLVLPMPPAAGAVVAAVPLALSLALPSIMPEDADAETAKYGRHGRESLVRRREGESEWPGAQGQGDGRRARTRVTPAFIQEEVGDA